MRIVADKYNGQLLILLIKLDVLKFDYESKEAINEISRLYTPGAMSALAKYGKAIRVYV